MPSSLDRLWLVPTGAVPDKGMGEPSFRVLAPLHLSLLLAVGALASLVAPVAAVSSPAAVGVAALLAGGYAAAGRVAVRRGTPLSLWMADALLALASVHAGLAAGLAADAVGAAPIGAILTGAVVAAAGAAGLYVRVRRIWLLTVGVAGVSAALVALTRLLPGEPQLIDAAYLCLVAAFLAAGAAGGAVRPPRAAGTLAGVVAVVGSQVALAGSSPLRHLLAAAVLAVVALGVVRTANVSALPVALIGGLVVLPQVVAPALSGWQTFLVTVQVVGCATAFLTAAVQGRSTRQLQTGGVFAAASVLVLGTAPIVNSQRDAAVSLIGASCLAGFFLAAAWVRRRPATVIAGLLIVLTVPDVLVRPFDTSSPAAYAFAQALLAFAAVGAAVVMDRRAPRFPTGDGAEDWLASPGIELTVPFGPASVHDAALRLVSSAGLTVYLADRACGRVAAGSAEQLVLGIGVWAFEGGSRVRIVGAPHDVQRFAHDLSGDLSADPGATLQPTRAAGG